MGSYVHFRVGGNARNWIRNKLSKRSCPLEYHLINSPIEYWRLFDRPKTLQIAKFDT